MEAASGSCGVFNVFKAKLNRFFRYDIVIANTHSYSTSPGVFESWWWVVLSFCLVQLMWAAGESHARCSWGASHLQVSLLDIFSVWTVQHWQIPPCWRITSSCYAWGETSFIQGGGPTRQGHTVLPWQFKGKQIESSMEKISKLHRHSFVQDREAGRTLTLTFCSSLIENLKKRTLLQGGEASF